VISLSQAYFRKKEGAIKEGVDSPSMYASSRLKGGSISLPVLGSTALLMSKAQRMREIVMNRDCSARCTPVKIHDDINGKRHGRRNPKLADTDSATESIYCEMPMSPITQDFVSQRVWPSENGLPHKQNGHDRWHLILEQIRQLIPGDPCNVPGKSLKQIIPSPRPPRTRLGSLFVTIRLGTRALHRWHFHIACNLGGYLQNFAESSHIW
jgi:hypothetical protein